MTLPPGTCVGSYEVLSLIGEGGMGEVYRARDPRLKRDVALKVLPARHAGDQERLSRFEREAMCLAALNHPRIGAVFGVEHAHGAPVLVLELVEGPTLAERITRGPIPEDAALAIAMQLIEALEAAHAAGIVHRDLKPANIKIRPDGAIKVLDFGIAKLQSTADADADSPTTPAPTEPGTVIGTTAYMSPEQARGEHVDQRADIWAFGVVVLEMITGRSPFAKNSAAETVSAVLTEEPNLDRAPASLRRVLNGCLQKDPRRRLRDVGDARLLLDEPAAVAPVAAGKLKWALAGLAFGIVAAASLATLRPQPQASPPDVVRFQFEPTASPVASGASAVSPDGRHLAYMGVGADGAQRMWIRDLDSLADRPLPGTEAIGAVAPIFWSPDSRNIAYDAGGRLRRVDRDGGLPTTICEVGVPIIGGSWSRDGVILFSAIGQSLMRVPAQGGTPTAVGSIALAPNEWALMPLFLQDGNRFLFLRASPGNVERNGIFAGALDPAAAPAEVRRILATPTSVAYVADAPGRGTVLFLRNQDLMAQALDETRLELTGEARLLAKGVDSYRDGATISVSSNGVLAYLNAAPLQFAWLDREGRIVKRGDDRGLYETLTLSPDGTKALMSQANSMATNVSELWLLDFVQSTKAKLTNANAQNAVWSADGTRVIFATDGGISQLQLGAGATPITLVPSLDRVGMSPTSWSADGQFLLYTLSGGRAGADIWVLPLQKPADARPLVNSAGTEAQAQFSPEPGSPRWLAYTANGSGREEVFMRSFDDTGTAQLVSIAGGHSPRWRGDGRELFFVTPNGELMAAGFAKNTTRTETPVKLFTIPAGFTSRDATNLRAHAPWGVTPDGQRFVFAVPAEATSRRQFTIILNWNSRAQPLNH